MRYLIASMAAALLFTSCSESSHEGNTTSVPRNNMRSFISKIKNSVPTGKQILLADGVDLVYRSPKDSTIELSFIQNNTNGIIPTNLYGVSDESIPTTCDSLAAVINTIDSLPKMAGYFIGTTEESYSAEHMDSLFSWNNQKGYKSFVLPEDSDFNVIPDYTGGLDSISSLPVATLSSAKNYLLFTENIAIADSTKPNGLNTHVHILKNLNYDLIVIKADVKRVRQQGQGLTSVTSIYSGSELDSIKTKGNSENKRLVFAEINLSKANSHQLYWKDSWNKELPSWMSRTEEEHIYNVDFQNSEWHDALLEPITFAKPSYITQIFTAGFDGIVLTGAEAFKELEVEE